ncbi:MAG: DUF4345 family protein [Acidobacteriota bacterium]
MWWKVLVVLLSVINVGFGLLGLVSPKRVGELVDLSPLNPSAHGELRAVFGGLLVALGVITVRALQQGDAGVLQAVGWGFLGLAVGRLISLALDGVTTYTGLALVFEAAAGLLLMYAAGQLRS